MKDHTNHGRNKQATTAQKADPCAQLISLHNTIPGEQAMQKAYQRLKLVIQQFNVLHEHKQTGPTHRHVLASLPL